MKENFIQTGIFKCEAVEAGTFKAEAFRDCLYDYRINGRKFKYTGRLPFSEVVSTNKEYMTHFGPCVDIAQRCVYSSSVSNYSSMLLRIVGARDKEEIKTFNNLKISPYRGHRGVFRVIEGVMREVKSKLKRYTDVLGDNLEEQINNACSPHVKQKLRVKSIKELIQKGNMLNSLFMKDIKGKIKIPEFAKLGKKPRLIGDYTCPGSLLAGFLVPCLKAAQSEPIVRGRSRFRFVYSTDSESLDSIFTEIDQSVYNEYVFFSDDMCCCLKTKGGKKWYNLDISSCDASNGLGVFERLLWMFDEHSAHSSLLEKAILQCKQRLVIHHPNKKVREVITAKCSLPIEFSGTQLTTLLNNIASLSIAISISYTIDRMMEKDEFGILDKFAKIVANSALAVGYEMTIDVCNNVEDVQFLKHSFYYKSDGSLGSFVNLGTLFRSMGTCWMDLPFNSKIGESLEGAARFRNWSVLQGYSHSGLSAILDSLAVSPGYQKPAGEYKVLSTRLTREKTYSLYQDSVSKRVPAPICSICRRYDLSEMETNQMLQLLRIADIGMLLSSPAFTKVVAKDYGYAGA